MDKSEARLKAERLLRSEFDRVYQRGIQRGLTIAAVMELGDHNGRHVDKVTGRYTEALDLVEASGPVVEPDVEGRIDVEAICTEWGRLGGECSKDHLGGGVLRTKAGQVIAIVETDGVDFFATLRGPSTRVTVGFMEELPKLAKAWGLEPRVEAAVAQGAAGSVTIAFAEGASVEGVADLIRQACDAAVRGGRS